MRKIIISFLVILIVAVIGIIAFLIKSVYYVKSGNELVVKTTETTTSEETSYYDEDGMLHKFWESEEVLEYPEDTSIWTVENEYMISAMIADYLDGSYTWYNYPISEKCINERATKYKELTDRFPGYEDNEYNKNIPLILSHYADVLNRKEYVTVRANKYQDIKYCYEYIVNDKDELDGIEYVSQEVVKDYTKEVEKKERVLLMIKEGDDIHEDDEYLRVLIAVTRSIEDLGTMEKLGAVNEIKERIREKTLFPLSNERGYYNFIRKKYANYDLKKVTIFAGSFYKKEFAKYQIDFDYNNEYYLTKFNVIDEEPISEEEFRLELKQAD